MGGRDVASLGKARRELEELYSGIPDESVNLTFQDFAQLPTAAAHHSTKSNTERKAPGLVITSNNNIINSSSSAPLTKLPSLDFSKAFEDTSITTHHHNSNSNSNDSYYAGDRKFYSSFMDHYGEEAAALHTSHLGTSTDPPPRSAAQDTSTDYNVNYGHGNLHHHHDQAISNNTAYHHHHQQGTGVVMGIKSDHHHDTISSSGTSSMMISNNYMDSFQGGTRRRRPGIPHSNICSICSVYIYMFRNNRCLVCGRVYCRQCVSIGMGELTEGRKCIQCLGKRFSQRYIDRAGKAGGGCCMGFLDSSSTSRAKQREIEWAEKGPRKSGGSNTNTNTTATPSRSRNYNHFSRSEVSPRTPTSTSTAPPLDFSRGTSPSPYSPYSTHSPASNYHFPL